MACTCQASNAMRWINQTVLDCDRVSWYLVGYYLHWGGTWSPVNVCNQCPTVCVITPRKVCVITPRKNLNNFVTLSLAEFKINNLVITKYAMHVQNTIMKNLKTKFIYFDITFQNKSTKVESFFLGIFGWGVCIIFVW